MQPKCTGGSGTAPAGKFLQFHVLRVNLGTSDYKIRSPCNKRNVFACAIAETNYNTVLLMRQ